MVTGFLHSDYSYLSEFNTTHPHLGDKKMTPARRRSLMLLPLQELDTGRGLGGDLLSRCSLFFDLSELLVDLIQLAVQLLFVVWDQGLIVRKIGGLSVLFDLLHHLQQSFAIRRSDFAGLEFCVDLLLQSNLLCFDSIVPIDV